jgi:hypothetical protein
MTDDYRGPAFFVREGGRRIATPLLAVLVAIETTDIMFALDSIPAVFAVTTDPFIVFSSNLFAILGLRALYFLLAGLLDRFVYLKLGLAALLVFAGAKILVSSFYDIPVAASLAVIVLILGLAIAASLMATHPNRSAWSQPLLRVASGLGLAAVALALVAFAAAVRDGATWAGPVGAGVIVAGSAGATAAGIIGLRRSVSPGLAAAAVRVGSGVLLGAMATGLLGGIVVLRDAGALWVALDIGILAAAFAAFILGFAALRSLRARPGFVRAWATAGAAVLLILALFIALD